MLGCTDISHFRRRRLKRKGCATKPVGCHITVLILACLVWARLEAASSSCQYENTTAVKVPIAMKICKDSDRFQESLKFLDENNDLKATVDIGGSGEDVWIEGRCSACDYIYQNESRAAVERLGCLNLKIILHDEKKLHILSNEDSYHLSLALPEAASIRVEVMQQHDSKTCFHDLTEAAPMVDHEALPLPDVVTVVPVVVLVTVAALVGVAMVHSVVVLVLTLWM
ncbi:hypothetical protein E2C01_000539 [Portunus trituberculatus]|uniref:Uncharacterized protein n=1 Tax=Portunus trituberculatus TaxID=210409 RepID=A0A5B7CFE3_PORTR|nr:hypothetical protein [Portunus trituberculatus]